MQSCNKTFPGETVRSFNTQRKECQKVVAGNDKDKQEIHQSASSNHFMSWNRARVIRTEDDEHQSFIREVVNWDEGATS